MMDRKTKVTMAGIGVGTIAMGLAAVIAWRKSDKQRAKFAAWKKNRIHDAYYKSLDESDIGWG